MVGPINYIRGGSTHYGTPGVHNNFSFMILLLGLHLSLALVYGFFFFFFRILSIFNTYTRGEGRRFFKETYSGVWI